MRVYNTLSAQKEELVPISQSEIKMYVCGPTTYNYIHLGNARPLVVFDTVRRYLEFRGYKVTYVQNFTDVDDKIINRAAEENVEPRELAERYINEYFLDADRLGIRRADVHPRVSEHIPQIIRAVEGLIDKGFAYEIDGDVYYRVKAFPEYGRLSHRSLEDMMAGARVEIDERKEEPMDFALWKSAKEGEPFWPSPWGKGRPGWHIECSVMSTQYLGNTLDIHGGGSDLIFPHHENEIAQAEGLTGQTFVRYWMHNGFITVNNEKMSKSLGNFFILRDILDKFPADVVRFYLIATQYRSPLDFDDGKLEEAHRALGRLKNTRFLVSNYIGDSDIIAQGESSSLSSEVEGLRDKFVEAMDDDFNTAKAIGYLFEMARLLNSFVGTHPRDEVGNIQAARQALAVFESLATVLGVFSDSTQDLDNTSETIVGLLLKIRDRARSNHDYQLSDHLRDFLVSNQVQVEDSKDASRFRMEQAPKLDILMEEVVSLRAKFKALKQYQEADFIREQLVLAGIVLEDTREGARWKFVDA